MLGKSHTESTDTCYMTILFFVAYYFVSCFFSASVHYAVERAVIIWCEDI